MDLISEMPIFGQFCWRNFLSYEPGKSRLTQDHLFNPVVVWDPTLRTAVLIEPFAKGVPMFANAGCFAVNSVAYLRPQWRKRYGCIFEVVKYF